MQANLSKQEVIRIPEWKRAVIKVGSNLVAPDAARCSTRYLLPIAHFITSCMQSGKEIILVSSGAVAAGLSTHPGSATKNEYSIPEKQALAAIGQTLLMDTWSRLFDFPCAQLLLTYDIISERKRYLNAKNAIRELLRWGVLPIVNENDTVAVSELKLGDNDNLAAYVAVLSQSDLLLICSDVDGLYDSDPAKNQDATLIRNVIRIDDTIRGYAGSTGSRFASGGMHTKIEAAGKATSGGIDTLIVNGRRHQIFNNLSEGFATHGTLFHRQSRTVAAKKHWMLHALDAVGAIRIDAGASEALVVRQASLLPSGIVGIEGDFQTGAAVRVFCEDAAGRQEIAKGIVQYNSNDLRKIMGKRSPDFPKYLNFQHTDYAIHRSDLVVLKTESERM